jgi:hypothetical protein
MKRIFAVLVTLAAVPLAGCSAEPEGAAYANPSSTDRAAQGAGAADVEAVIAQWPDQSRMVAEKAIGVYGEPHEVAEGRLVWHDVGDWKRVVAYREVVEHNFPMPHIDVLEGFIDYRVPPDRMDDLTRFTGSIYADRTRGEISARCDKEGANFLSVNLAHDILTNRRSVEEARQLYTEVVRAFMEREEMHPYMQGFQSSTPQIGTADPDQSTIDM